MISVRLVLAVASFLFITDAAPTPVGTASCEDSEDELCAHINAAHSGNVEAMLLLTDDTNAAAKDALMEVNELLFKLLNDNTSESLFETLKQALEKELSALTTLNTDSSVTDYCVRCTIACHDVKFAVKEIMLAIMEAETNDDKKVEIRAVAEKTPVSPAKGTDTCDSDSDTISRGRLVLKTVKGNDH